MSITPRLIRIAITGDGIMCNQVHSQLLKQALFPDKLDVHISGVEVNNDIPLQRPSKPEMSRNLSRFGKHK